MKIRFINFLLSATPAPSSFNFKETAVTVLESSGFAEVTILRENNLQQRSYVSKYKESPLNSLIFHPIRVVEQGNYHVIVYHVYSGVQHPMISMLSILYRISEYPLS